MESERVDALVTSQTSAWTEYVTGLPRLRRPRQPDEVGNYACFVPGRGVRLTLVHSNWKLELEPHLPAFGYEVHELDANGRTDGLHGVLEPPRCAWVDADMSFIEFAALRDAFPATEFVLIGPAAWRVRAAKSDFEVERMRAAAQGTERAYRTLAAALPERFSAADFLQECQAQFELHGIHELAVALNVYVRRPASALEWGWTRAQARDYVVEPPAVVTVDSGARVDGYAADLGRTLVLGELLPAWRHAYDTAYAAQAALVEAVRPGLTGRDADAISRAIVEANGLGETFWIPSGHALGLDVHEPPRLAASDGSALAERMALSLEIGLWDRTAIGVDRGIAAFVEDTAIVRADGVEMVTASPSEPIPIG